MTQTLLYRIFLSAITIFLVGCSQYGSRPPVTKAIPNTPLPDIWNIQAKLGVRTTDDSGSVTLAWQQNHNNYRIGITGPLGQGSGIVIGNDGYMYIERPNKTPIASSDPSDLIERSFGWPLPITLLPYWVRGVAEPNQATNNEQYDDTGILREISQAGWQLSFSRHQIVDKWLLPHKIIAAKNDVTLTLIIRSWKFPTTTNINTSSSDQQI